MRVGPAKANDDRMPVEGAVRDELADAIVELTDDRIVQRMRIASVEPPD